MRWRVLQRSWRSIKTRNFVRFFLKQRKAVYLSHFKQKTTPIEGWATYSPSRLGGSLAYAIVFGCAFTSDLQQKTTSVQRWATYPTDRSAGNFAYAIVFGCAFTSGIYISIYFFARSVKFFSIKGRFFTKFVYRF